jgi:hypothetical protein
MQQSMSKSSILSQKPSPADYEQLTPEQLTFARLLGQLFSEQWRQEQLADIAGRTSRQTSHRIVT